METQLLVMFSVGTLLVLNGLFGRTSLLDTEDSRSVILEPADADADDDARNALGSASDEDTASKAA